jgi:ribonucleoside-diphosphate reductase alpha chain
VVGVYVAAGREYGYFASAKDAEIFEHELAYALIHQVFSFNSPVWFNVGTSSPQQVSACQPYDALVSTTAGLIPIGKLVEDDAVGTKVHDAHGTTRIVATKANGVKEVRLHARSTTPWTSPGRLAGPRPRHRRVHGRRVLRPGDCCRWIPTSADRPLARSAGSAREMGDIQTESGEYLA